MAVAVALGATSMSDIAVLAHLAPVLGDAPSGPTVRRALDLAGTPAMLDRIARARSPGGRPAGSAFRQRPGRDSGDGLAGAVFVGTAAAGQGELRVTRAVQGQLDTGQCGVPDDTSSSLRVGVIHCHRVVIVGGH
jgi:hypothetical protein